MRAREPIGAGQQGLYERRLRLLERAYLAVAFGEIGPNLQGRAVFICGCHGALEGRPLSPIYGTSTRVANGTDEEASRALRAPDVRAAAEAFRSEGGLTHTLLLGAALADAAGEADEAEMLRREAEGFEGVRTIPEGRRVMAYASPFPVRALDLGLLDPEEVFMVNQDKFARVRFALLEPAAELESMLEQLVSGGVLALKSRAEDVVGDAADVPEDTEVFLYVLPREVRQVVERCRKMALDTIVQRLVQAIPPVSAN